MGQLSQSETLVVIPVYNHADKLRGVIQKAFASGWKVLVVDDGSTDDVLSHISELPCEVLSLAVNMGKGVAILAGAKWAEEKGYKAIITIDADGQLNPAEAGLLLAQSRKEWPMIVIGSRRMDQKTVPRSSIFGRSFSNFWVRLECGMDLPDTQSGFRLYPVSEILNLPIYTKRYDFEVEVLVRAAWSGLPIRSVSVSVDYPQKGERVSHFHQFKDNFRLTMLHTKLVLRSLSPVPHKKILWKKIFRDGICCDFDYSILHPVRLFKKICGEHTSTFQLAIAAWVGTFLGALPLLAVHTIVIVYVAHKLHLNKLAAIAASQFCAPPVVPILCIQVGYLLRTGNFLTEFSWETLVLQMHQRLWEWLIGSLFVGPALGMALALLTYWGVYTIRGKKRVGHCD